jgi:hypothetical protein
MARNWIGSVPGGDVVFSGAAFPMAVCFVFPRRLKMKVGLNISFLHRQLWCIGVVLCVLQQSMIAVHSSRMLPMDVKELTAGDMMGGGTQHHDEVLKDQWRMHTLFSVECLPYFDWQTVGLMHSFRKSGQPGPITRLLSCTEDVLSSYKGMDLAPTHLVPSMSHHPVTGDWWVHKHLPLTNPRALASNSKQLVALK